MKLNRKSQSPRTRTYEGAPANSVNAAKELRRSVSSCLLWEDAFYEDGEEIAHRIVDLCSKVSPIIVSDLAKESRSRLKLRHVPLLLCRELARRGNLQADVLAEVVQRPDELSEFLAIYWKDGKEPLANQVKKGLAKAFQKFNEYQLAKYNRDGEIKLRDVLFLSHAKPKNEEQALLWKRLVSKELAVPDTWEVILSSGANKKKAWTKLLLEDKLGALALLRNLRNMEAAKVPKNLIEDAISKMDVSRVLPFRFIAAARYAPGLESFLQSKMLECTKELPKLSGKTVLLLDVSGSMNDRLSAKSDMSRLDAACGLAIILRELCEEVEIFTFSEYVKQVPARNGFSLRDAIQGSQPHSGTYLGQAVSKANQVGGDRLVVITDEQSHDAVGSPKGFKNSYMINVATYKNEVGYGKWTRINGFSENIISWMKESEELIS